LIRLRRSDGKWQVAPEGVAASEEPAVIEAAPTEETGIPQTPQDAQAAEPDAEIAETARSESATDVTEPEDANPQPESATDTAEPGDVVPNESLGQAEQSAPETDPAATAQEPGLDFNPPEVGETPTAAIPESVAGETSFEVPESIVPVAPSSKPDFAAPDIQNTIPEQPQPAPKPAAAPKRRRWLLIPIITLAVLLVAATGGFAYANHYYKDRVFPGVSLGATKIAGQTEDQLTDTVSGLLDKTTIRLTDGTTTKAATLADLGVATDIPATVHTAVHAMDDSNIFVRLNPFKKKQTVVATSDRDEDALRTFLMQTFVPEDQQATNATVALDEASGTFTVTPASPGKAVDLAPVNAAIDSALADPGNTADLQVNVINDTAPITDAAAQAAADQANSRLSLKLTINDGNGGTYTVPASDIAAWTHFTNDEATGTVNVTYDADTITASLPGKISEALDHPAVPNEKLISPEGKVIVTKSKGVDGVKVADPNAPVTDVLEALANGTDATITAPTEIDKFQVLETKVPSNYSDPEGAHWVEVNLSTQTATLWRGSTLDSSYTISSGLPDHPSDQGTFYVWYKTTKQTMSGPGYSTPNVPWNTFYNGDEALHGTYWHNNFGHPMSHGCINMRIPDAKYVYDFAPLGTRVVVHT
jgi:lipoprotein-anchoring transpeptidase ErfK/SrfK